MSSTHTHPVSTATANTAAGSSVSMNANGITISAGAINIGSSLASTSHNHTGNTITSAGGAVTGWTISDSYTRSESRLDRIEKKLSHLEDFLNMKGITSDEFKEFVESRELADKMVKDAEIEASNKFIRYIDVKTSVNIPASQIWLSTDTLKTAVKNVKSR